MSSQFTTEWLLDRQRKINEQKSNLPNRTALPDAEQCERPKALETSSEGEAQGTRLLHVCFTLHRKKLLDVDAKYASAKDLLDFLATCGIISGDREGEITLEVNQIKSKEEKTVIQVYL